ncbi:MAG TPA: hypothetical protein VMK65_04900 [Longimicrobiales bacterium]|nr:hypothetical protein [Longimicrobiales bacterium]
MVNPRGAHDDDAEPPPQTRALPARARSRSFSFVERDGERWSVFLVTWPGEDGYWRGHFAFRPASGPTDDEIRTAALWTEESEAAIDMRARGLGRPLILSLLNSALGIHERRRGYSADVRRWFRDLLARHAATLLPDIGRPSDEVSLAQLQSLYQSYRIDQVAHLVALMPERHFKEVVDRLLDGKSVDFKSRDRLQMAMLVVQELEQYLPLPPLEVWTEDYLAHREEYHRYAHALHREGRLT